MSDTVSKKAKELEIVAAIPVLQTVSLRMVLNHFGESIVGFEAAGGVSNVTKTDVVDEELGIRVSETKSVEVGINFEQNWSITGELLIPINDKLKKRFLDPIDKNKALEGDEQADIAVSGLVIVKDDPDLAKIAAEHISWYDGQRTKFLMFFENDPAENPEGQPRKPFEEIIAKNRGLGVSNQGFKARVLNLRGIIERERFYGSEKNLYIAKWDGPGDNHPKCEIEIARHIYMNYFPVGYGELNMYYRDRQETLMLDGWESK